MPLMPPSLRHAEVTAASCRADFRCLPIRRHIDIVIAYLLRRCYADVTSYARDTRRCALHDCCALMLLLRDDARASASRGAARGDDARRAADGEALPRAL